MSALLEIHEHEVETPTVVETKVEVRLPARRLIEEPQSAMPLFADVLLETTSFQRRRRGWASLLSLLLQCTIVAAALIAPLMYTEALPKQQLLAFLVAPTPPPPPPPPAAPAAARAVRQIESDLIAGGQLRTPTRIPQKVQMVREDEAPPPAASLGGVIGGVPGGIPGGQLGGVIGGIISSTSSLAAVPKLSAPVMPKRVRISEGVTQGLLISRVEPKYPLLAKQARIQGEVVLTAIISRSGGLRTSLW